MKTIIMAVAILLAGTVSFAQTKMTTTTTKTHMHHHGTMAHKYTCSMHPEVVRSKPGKCPKCNMKLIAMKKMKKETLMADKKPDEKM
jgi:Cu(I)/Ag(I) efflux system membrane fusion protein